MIPCESDPDILRGRSACPDTIPVEEKAGSETDSAAASGHAAEEAAVTETEGGAGCPGVGKGPAVDAVAAVAA